MLFYPISLFAFVLAPLEFHDRIRDLEGIKISILKHCGTWADVLAPIVITTAPPTGL